LFVVVIYRFYYFSYFLSSSYTECPQGFRADKMGTVAQDKKGKITIATLAALRLRLNVLKDAYKMAKAKVEGTKLLAYHLEDLVKAMENPTYGGGGGGGEEDQNNINFSASARPVIHWSLTDSDSTPEEYNWHIKTKPILLKLAAFVCLSLSILSFLGVVCSMEGVDNAVSPYFLIVHAPHGNPIGIGIFIFISFSYTVYITIWAIFEIRLGSAYELVPFQSTPEAVSFNVRMVARLAPPLAFFYLGWISENGIRSGPWAHNEGYNGPLYQNVTLPLFNNVTNTTDYYDTTILVNSTALEMPSVFSHFYQLQAIGPVQKVFGTICPCILFIVLALFLLNIFNRLLVCFKLDRYQFGARKFVIFSVFRFLIWQHCFFLFRNRHGRSITRRKEAIRKRTSFNCEFFQHCCSFLSSFESLYSRYNRLDDINESD
jgi:hypothetical protein